MKSLKPVGGIHAVQEALESNMDIDKLLVEKGHKNPRVRELVAMARKKGVKVQEVPYIKAGNLNHQGILIYPSAVELYQAEDIVAHVFDQGLEPFLLILDQVSDVRNFGAICRTAHIAGADAVVIPEKGSAAIGPDAMKTSSGALMHLPVCREKDLKETIKNLKNSGLKIIALTEKGKQNLFETDLTGPIAILSGSEDTGISADLLRLADDLCAIPEYGKIQSLNVSVATGIALYESIRQKLFA